MRERVEYFREAKCRRKSNFNSNRFTRSNCDTNAFDCRWEKETVIFQSIDCLDEHFRILISVIQFNFLYNIFDIF